MTFKVEYSVTLDKAEQQILLEVAIERGLNYPDNTKGDKTPDKRTLLKRLFEKYGDSVRGMK